MIAAPEMLVALRRLSLTNAYVPTAGMSLPEVAEAWADTLNDELLNVTRDDLVAGVRSYAREASTGWPKPSDLIPHVRAAYRARTRPAWCGTCSERERFITAEDTDGRPVVVRCPTCHPMTKQLTNH